MILLIAAALGIVGGVGLAEFRIRGETPLIDDDSVSDAVAKVMPLGRATAERDPMEPDPETLDGITPYPGAAPRKLTSHTSVSGMPMKVSWFSTKDSVSDVLAFYRKAFVADDRMVVSHRFNDGVGYVAWVDRNDPTPPRVDGGEYDPLLRSAVHMVSVVHQPQETLVFISRSQPHDFFTQPLHMPDGVLLPPSADTPQVIELNEFSLDRRTIYSRARGMTLTQTRGFFERELTATGWRIDDGTEADDRESIVVKRGAATQVITLVPDGENTRILITLDGRAAPEMSR